MSESIYSFIYVWAASTIRKKFKDCLFFGVYVSGFGCTLMKSRPIPVHQSYSKYFCRKAIFNVLFIATNIRKSQTAQLSDNTDSHYMMIRIT